MRSQITRANPNKNLKLKSTTASQKTQLQERTFAQALNVTDEQ